MRSLSLCGLIRGQTLTFFMFLMPVRIELASSTSIIAQACAAASAAMFVLIEDCWNLFLLSHETL